MMDTLKELLLDAALVFLIFTTTAGAQCQPRSCRGPATQQAAAQR